MEELIKAACENAHRLCKDEQDRLDEHGLFSFDYSAAWLAYVAGSLKYQVPEIREVILLGMERLKDKDEQLAYGRDSRLAMERFCLGHQISAEDNPDAWRIWKAACKWVSQVETARAPETNRMAPTRYCEDCNQLVPLKCADPSGNLESGFCERQK